MKYDVAEVRSILFAYAGKDEKTACLIDAVFAADQAEQDALCDAVLCLANLLPNTGPLTALEIVHAVARFWHQHDDRGRGHHA